MTTALLGAAPTIQAPFKPYPSIGAREAAAVQDVIASGCLSGFYGSAGAEFLGGPKVKAFEAAWAKQFSVRHAISVNSATSGLYAAVGAAGIGPGDEIIVPPYTMSASAMAPLIYGGIPVFADIEEETFCLSVESVEELICDKTRAIIAVNLFGHPARLADLRRLADKHNLILIEDNAQAPFAMEGNMFAGTIGHIGVFSLNYHKHIHTGEGGMVVTADDQLAVRLQAIRNHAENVVDSYGLSGVPNMIGFNYRMTELSAAVGLAQLEDADIHIRRRTAIADALTHGVEDLPGITPPAVRDGCKHVYYTWSARFNASEIGINRELFCRALEAEGVPIARGYVKPLYLLPVFRDRCAIGKQGFPFNLTARDYKKGLCPVAERLHESELIFFETCAYDLSTKDTEAIVSAFRKVYAARQQLAELA